MSERPRYCRDARCKTYFSAGRRCVLKKELDLSGASEGWKRERREEYKELACSDPEELNELCRNRFCQIGSYTERV